MSQNKYDAIIARTTEASLKRIQYTKILNSMKNKKMSVVDLTLHPNPGTETYCVLFITDELFRHFSCYDIPTFIQHYKYMIDNVEQTYEDTLTINDTEYLIKVQ